MSDPRADPRAELATLVGATRSLLEAYEATGAIGAPPTPKGAPTKEAPISRERGERRGEAEGRAENQLAAAPPTERRPQAAAREPAAAPQVQVSHERPVTPAPSAPATPAAGGGERALHLAVLAEEVRGCTACALAGGRTQTVFARGNPAAELCFVGEGPGAEEDLQGFPFVGKAGQLLDRMIAAMGYQRDDVYVMNAVKCRPPNNRKPEPDEMAACSRFFTRQLALVEPKVIVALGATSVQALIGTSEGITRMRGKWKLYKGKIPIMPTFHPAYLLRQPGAKRDVWNDLQEVMRHLGKPVRRGE